MKQFYLTTPIYYVNAKPHIGHAYTTVAADVLARYFRINGDSFFLTGTDDHGVKIAQAAAAAGKSPETFTAEIADSFKKTWEKLGITYSRFIRTEDPDHKKVARDFLQQLKDERILYESTYEGLYCVGCENFVPEKNLNAEGECPDHNARPERITEKNWFFPLRKYVPRIQTLIEKDEIRITPAFAKKEVFGLLKQDLQDFSVSRPGDRVRWGIPVPWDETQTIYVWVEALLNYYSATKMLGGPTWPADLHIIGKDIVKFHAVYWPALLLAAKKKTPRKIFAHGFFTVNGQKMSKSLGNVIDPNALVEVYGKDAVRYLLLAQFPFGQDGDFSEAKFQEQYNAHLSKGLGNSVQRLTTLAQQKEIRSSWLTIPSEFSPGIPKMYESLSFELVIQHAQQAIAGVDKRLSEKKPWESSLGKGTQRVLTKSASSLLQVAYDLAPIMPDTSGKIFGLFAQSDITPPTAPLFPRK